MKLLVLLAMLAAGGQEPQVPQAPKVPQPQTAAPAPVVDTAYDLQEYRLGPGDRLSIYVSGARVFEQTARISNSGRIRVAYVGVMFVAGRTAFEIEQEIARLIKERELVNEPSVQVRIEEFRAQPIFAIGEVVNPGQFVTADNLRLLDLITKAGGLTTSAGEQALLYRRSQPQPAVQARVLGPADIPSAGHAESLSKALNGRLPQTDEASSGEVIAIDLKDLREGTRPETNLTLQGGDILYVPRTRRDSIYIIGDVKVPGVYDLPRRGSVTAAQALVYAGGPLSTAKHGKTFIMRRDARGDHVALPVNFSAIVSGKEPDIPILPNDIIFVPNSALKTTGQALFNYIPELIRQFIIF
jgi:polysaccharide export outer membrane protein